MPDLRGENRDRDRKRGFIGDFGRWQLPVPSHPPTRKPNSRDDLLRG